MAIFKEIRCLKRIAMFSKTLFILSFLLMGEIAHADKLYFAFRGFKHCTNFCEVGKIKCQRGLKHGDYDWCKNNCLHTHKKEREKFVQGVKSCHAPFDNFKYRGVVQCKGSDCHVYEIVDQSGKTPDTPHFTPPPRISYNDFNEIDQSNLIGGIIGDYIDFNEVQTNSHGKRKDPKTKRMIPYTFHLIKKEEGLRLTPLTGSAPQLQEKKVPPR